MLVRVFGFVRCIITLKGNSYVGMFEEVGHFSYFWPTICECCPPPIPFLYCLLCSDSGGVSCVVFVLLASLGVFLENCFLCH